MRKTLLITILLALGWAAKAQDGRIYLGADTYGQHATRLDDLKQKPPCSCTLADVCENACTTRRPIYSTDNHGTETMIDQGNVLNRHSGYLWSALYVDGGKPTLVLADPDGPFLVSTQADHLTANRKHLEPDNDGTYIAAYTGHGDPNGVVTAVPGKIYINLDGGAGVTMWVKETGTGTTGWAAK